MLSLEEQNTLLLELKVQNHIMRTALEAVNQLLTETKDFKNLTETDLGFLTFFQTKYIPHILGMITTKPEGQVVQ